MALPAIDSIRSTFPDASIDLFVGAHSAGVFQDRQDVNICLFNPDIPTARHFWRLVSGFRQGYDQIYVLDRSRLVQYAARLSGTAQYSLTGQTEINTHEIDAYLGVVHSAGIQPVIDQPTLRFTPETRNAVGGLLDKIEPPFLVVHPGGAVNPGSIMIQKRWPERRLIDLLNALTPHFRTIVYTGGPDEARFCQRIANAVESSLSLVVAGELTLMETACLISKANLYIGVDTGVSHLAAATGVPCVVIFGPTNPLRYGPRGERVIIVAPEESYAIGDRDLRKNSSSRSEISTQQVTLDDVLQACKSQLSFAKSTHE